MVILKALKALPLRLPFKVRYLIGKYQRGISFVFGIQGAPGRAAGRLQGLFSSISVILFLSVLASFPLVPARSAGFVFGTSQLPSSSEASSSKLYR